LTVNVNVEQPFGLLAFANPTSKTTLQSHLDLKCGIWKMACAKKSSFSRRKP